MPKTEILVFLLSYILLIYWANTLHLQSWHHPQVGPHIQVMPDPHILQILLMQFFHIFVCLFSLLGLLPRFSNVSIITSQCPTIICPDRATKLVFLACCFEYASSLYPSHHQFPSFTTVIFLSFRRHNLSFTVKTSVPVPAGSPPTFSPTITCMFSFVTNTYVLLVLEEVPCRHQKCFFLIPETFLSKLLHSDTCTQVRLGAFYEPNTFWSPSAVEIKNKRAWLDGENSQIVFFPFKNSPKLNVC